MSALRPVLFLALFGVLLLALTVEGANFRNPNRRNSNNSNNNNSNNNNNQNDDQNDNQVRIRIKWESEEK
jgi:hypothetical protein